MSQEVKYVRVLLGYHGSANCGESALGQVYFDALTDITDGETDEPLTEEEIIAWAEEEFEEYEIFDQPVRFDTLTGKRGQYRSNRPDMETITQAQIKSEEADQEHDGIEDYDYNIGYTLGSDPANGPYYTNGESEEFMSGFVDGRLSLYERVEDEEGNIRDAAKRDAVLDVLATDGIRSAIAEIKHWEEGV